MSPCKQWDVADYTKEERDLCVWIIRTLIFEDIDWPPVKNLLYFAHPLHVEKLMQLLKATS